ncbi:hypothetical protein [Kitasatospora kifunensis]|uniref:Uncharacterized protein n=1 Tax=Kitasatospora kifunensis TaxID=58351 RepID=A0A7W7VYC3_KITKI|nr:hypothetical protein [Kitasatospora kifunensis]MBB4927537.1 hypothetical protein [Kitasatospora kifunensis]
MSVYVKLASEARSPAEPSSGPLDVQYEDNAAGATYEYDVHPSGALRILRVSENGPHVVEGFFGPGAWLQVVGAYRRSGSEY